MKYKRIIIWASVVMLSFSVGFVSDITDDYFEISKNLDIFGRVYREINATYVEDTDPSELMRVGIDAMLNSLDPYTTYISEDEAEDFSFFTTGQYGGIGALIGKRTDRLLVIEPYVGSPAAKAGLKPGDQLVRVNDTEIDGKTMQVSDVRNLLRGDKGVELTIVVKREGKTDPITVNLERDRIKIPNVPYSGMVNDKIGYISLTGFTEDAGAEVSGAMRKLRQEHKDLGGVILDLRSNPGGRLDQAIRVANVFIPQKETIVETRGRMADARRVLRATRQAIDSETPLVVLVNGRSASASEIVAGAIQDLDRGVIIGQRSFGKGLVQNIRPLNYSSQLKVTTAKYYTPSGRCIQAIDYAERDEEGRVTRIPDSLKTAFSTRNGRTVYDGGGIEPDLEVDEQIIQPITIALNRQGLIFDFAVKYASRNAEISSVRDFRIDDALYQEFIAYAESKDFDYETRAERQLEKLSKTIEDEAYAGRVSEDLEALKSRLEAQKDKDFNKHREEIALLLKQEIVKYYYFKAGGIEATFDFDDDIKAAVGMLEDQKSYDKTLSGTSN
ncbi:MAG: S41 family peptidase [Bacteroidota bacterium]